MRYGGLRCFPAPGRAGSAQELAEARRAVEAHQRALGGWEEGVSAQMAAISGLQDPARRGSLLAALRASAEGSALVGAGLMARNSLAL